MNRYWVTYCTMLSGVAAIFRIYKGHVTHKEKMGSVLLSRAKNLSRFVPETAFAVYIEQKNQPFYPGLIQYQISSIMRKPIFMVSDQVRHKVGYTATEDGLEAQNCRFLY